LSFDYYDATFGASKRKDEVINLFSKVNSKKINLDFEIKGNAYNDYNLQLLLPQKQSSKMKLLEKADLNGDSLEDLIIGNTKGYASAIYIQSPSGNFTKTNVKLLEKDKDYQIKDILVFDADNDGDNDIYMAHGGYEYISNTSMLNNVLYVNNGQGDFVKNNKTIVDLSTNVSVVKSVDFDMDGNHELFIFGGVKPGAYPMADQSYVLKKVDGQFVDVTSKIIPELNLLDGFIQDAELSDYDNDGDIDLIVLGEWMPIVLFENKDGVFVKQNPEELQYTNGWWNTISKVDLDKDGDDDFILGNLGNNNKFKATPNKPLHVFAKDFDQNGSFDVALSKSYNGALVPLRGRDCSSQQNAFILDKAPTFKMFANSNIEDLYGRENIASSLHLKTYTLSTSYLINQGEGKFVLKELPVEAQFSPTLDFEIFDINNDGFKDIVGVGNYYDTEVETVSYDAGRGYVLLADGKGGYDYAQHSGLNLNDDTRSISNVLINQNRHIIVAPYDGKISIYKLNE